MYNYAWKCCKLFNHLYECNPPHRPTTELSTHLGFMEHMSTYPKTSKLSREEQRLRSNRVIALQSKTNGDHLSTGYQLRREPGWLWAGNHRPASLRCPWREIGLLASSVSGRWSMCALLYTTRTLSRALGKEGRKHSIMAGICGTYRTLQGARFESVLTLYNRWSNTLLCVACLSSGQLKVQQHQPQWQ